jgi:hypothetical protein
VLSHECSTCYIADGNRAEMSDNASIIDSFGSPSSAFAAIGVMMATMAFLFPLARKLWREAEPRSREPYMGFIFVYVSLILVGLGSVFLTGYALTSAFSKSVFVYPDIMLMFAQIALLLLAPIIVTRMSLTSMAKQSSAALSLHFMLVFAFVVFAAQIHRASAKLADSGNLNVLLAFGILVVTSAFEAGIIYSIVGKQREQETGGGNAMKGHKERKRLRSRDMPIWYPWTARLALLALCIFGSILLWGWVLHSELRFWQFDSGDWLPIVALSFGTYTVIQTLLRYISTPTPEIRIDEESPVRLGPSEPLNMPANATEDEMAEIRLANFRRQFAALKIAVWNKDVAWWWRPLLLKEAPEGCRIRLRYTRISDKGEEPALNDEWLYGRWDDTPEPLSQIVTANGQRVTGYDLKTALANRRLAKLFPTEEVKHPDAYPFSLAFAMKKEGDLEFYHFNDESYAWGPGWRNPHWGLSPGIYRVDVRLTGYRLLGSAKASFRLKNLGPAFTDWRLEEWTDADQ